MYFVQLRIAMVLAVLEARCGLSLSSAEVYLNIAGGYRLSDPAADLAGGGSVSIVSRTTGACRHRCLRRDCTVGRSPSVSTPVCGLRNRPSSALNVRGCQRR